ncbi:MAG: hypothetical protein E7328_00520 [Clostridiales bacterium]|nr:hypothetical protein [Clostridiales bacterium]
MNQPSVVVCVTDQQSCVRLIHEGSRISVENSLPLYVLSVVPLKVAPRSCGEALEYLFSASREAGAEMTVFYHCDVLSTALSFIHKRNAAHVVLGQGSTADSSFIKGMMEGCGASIHVVDKNGSKTDYPTSARLDYNRGA